VDLFKPFELPILLLLYDIHYPITVTITYPFTPLHIHRSPSLMAHWPTYFGDIQQIDEFPSAVAEPGTRLTSQTFLHKYLLSAFT
jgi:hypothetical protein